jgi:hypothetical protein
MGFLTLLCLLLMAFSVCSRDGVASSKEGSNSTETMKAVETELLIILSNYNALIHSGFKPISPLNAESMRAMASFFPLGSLAFTGR